MHRRPSGHLDLHLAKGIFTFPEKGASVLEDSGRFLRPKKQNSIRLTPDGMSVDGIAVIRKSLDKGTSRTKFEICERPEFADGDAVRERLTKIGRCLAEGRQAEAIFLATMATWRLTPSEPGNEIAKANFNTAEPRDRGEWSKAGADSTSPHIEQVQYRGYFHDFMLNNLLQSLTSHGAVAIKNVEVFGISGTLAIPDGAALPFGFPKPFFIEMKTGFDAEFTPNQREVYPMICTGGHAVSFDPRLRELGLIPGAPLPPMNIMIAHTYGPGMAMSFHNYCTDFLE